MAAATASAQRENVAANAALVLLAEIDKVVPRAIQYAVVQVDDRAITQASVYALKLATRHLLLS